MLYVAKEELGAMEQITVTRAFKYQNDAGHSETARNLLREAIVKKYPTADPATVGRNEVEPMAINECLAFMQDILTKKHGKGYELNPHDFETWFNERASLNVTLPDGSECQALRLSCEDKFAELFELCSRKRSQMALPIQTFLPLKQI